MAKKEIPKFPKEIRDEILNWTDDKEHRSMIKCADSPFETVILAGGKGWGKSFMFPCVAVYNILNDPNYYCVMGRNLKIDIKNTLKATLEEFLGFLHFKYNINLIPFFEINSEEAVFKPTKQKIFFESFNKQSAFAGFNVGSYNGFIGDIFLDEIMQKRSTFSGMTSNDIDEFYRKQEEDFKTIKKGTILRKAAKAGDRKRHIYISCNLWEPEHWIIKKYFDKLMPLGPQNYEELETKHYIYKESDELDCAIMRASKFYVPANSISQEQMKDILDDKQNNFPLYLATTLGEAYLENDLNQERPFKNLIFDGDFIKPDLFFDVNEFNPEKIIAWVDGWDPAIVDKNGFCRIALTDDFKIYVLLAEELDTSKIQQLKRHNTLNLVLNKIIFLNNSFNASESILAIDSKDDAIIEMAMKATIEHNYPIAVAKAIKNKNVNFKIDFSIQNRMKFIYQFISNRIIQFSPACQYLLECLSKIVLDENDPNKRNEKINSQIYDIINAFEYALSVVYKQIILNHEGGKINA